MRESPELPGRSSSTLVQKAEQALKHAKETGEQYLHYKLEMRSEIAERLALEHKLREAIDEQQFEPTTGRKSTSSAATSNRWKRCCVGTIPSRAWRCRAVFFRVTNDAALLAIQLHFHERLLNEILGLLAGPAAPPPQLLQIL
jgi:predicted signal transduction protein with EAL and GGDEF domain